MGLFIGASILTILELFDYAYEVSLQRSPARTRHLRRRRLRSFLTGAPTAEVWLCFSSEETDDERIRARFQILCVSLLPLS